MDVIILLGGQNLENQSEDEFEYEIEDIMENLFHILMNPEHDGIIDGLVRVLSLNNRGAGDFHDWESSLKKIGH